jgi:hypothetical protein
MIFKEAVWVPPPLDDGLVPPHAATIASAAIAVNSR